MNSDGQYVYLITIYDSIYHLSNWYNNEDYSIIISNNVIKLWQSITCSSSGQYVYAVAENDLVYRSINYGSTWLISYHFKKIWASVSTSSSGQYVYSLVNGEYIYRSSDYGNSWSISNPSDALWSFVIVANTSVYATDSFGKIFLSDVTSNLWAKINSDNIQDAIVSISYDNNYGYILAPNLPVYSLNQIRPTASPTKSPTNSPTKNPTYYPTLTPSNYPTANPSFYPSNQPTNNPSNSPSIQPTNYPTLHPSNMPTISPTVFPTNHPTNYPSTYPTKQPTISPSTAMPSKSPTISPTTINHIPYAITTNGLVAFADFTDSRSYSGSGSSYTNIVDSSSQYFFGTYSQNSDKSMRIVNSGSGCGLAASGIHLNNYNIYTVSMWIRRESSQSSCSYLIDARSGLTNGFIYNVQVGNSWTNMSINGAAYTYPIDVYSTILPISTWTYVTLVASAQGNAGIFFASRFTETEGFDCSIKAIYVYSTFINQTTNYANYVASSSFISPTNTPTKSPTASPSIN